MRRPPFPPATAAALAGLVSLLTSMHSSALQPARQGALDASAPITYFIADGREVTGFRESDRELAAWALKAWERSAGGAFRLEESPQSAAIVRVHWAPPRGGQYGEMRPLIVGGRRGASVFIRPDVESLGADLADRARSDALLRDGIVYLTCVHEIGHALGLEHTRDFRDIMYFFGYGGDIIEYFDRYRRQLANRNDIAAVSGLSDADIGRLKALYSKPSKPSKP